MSTSTISFQHNKYIIDDIYYNVCSKLNLSTSPIREVDVYYSTFWHIKVLVRINHLLKMKTHYSSEWFTNHEI